MDGPSCTRMVRCWRREEDSTVISQHIYNGSCVLCVLTPQSIVLRCVGVFNAMEGCDGEIEMSPGLTESTMGNVR